MDFKRILTSSQYHPLVLGLTLSLLTSSVCIASVSNNQLQQLEKEFQNTSSKLYTSLAKNLNECKIQKHSMQLLNAELKELSNKGIIGTCLIQNHLTLIEKNIDSKEIFPIVEYLLENNSLSLANKIFNIAKNEADHSLLSNISFIYARYYLKRKKWNDVLNYIQGTYNDLANENANLALLFTGIALQKTKKHRKAVKMYSKISPQSKYYPAAQLNIATAYIRQDWWTDAHIKIKEVLENPKVKTNNEMVNRLYLVLGYSLLRKEFYRDSRDAFRNVEINSIYSHKALLGIALTATNQEDYISALNAIKILKSKKTYDLPVDESHLLLPYTYEKLGQNMTASASYADAQKYYQQRINNIKQTASNKAKYMTAKEILGNNNFVSINKNIVDFTQYYPITFLENSARTNEFSNYIVHINDSTLIKKYAALKSKHDYFLNEILSDVFNKRLSYLNSYLNQSRFGLARLFDNSNISNN